MKINVNKCKFQRKILLDFGLEGKKISNDDEAAIEDLHRKYALKLAAHETKCNDCKKEYEAWQEKKNDTMQI